MKSMTPLAGVVMALLLSAPVSATGTPPPVDGEVSVVTTVDRPVAAAGSPVTQTATVTDTGALPLLGLRVLLDLAPGCGRSVALLLPRQTVTVTCRGTAGTATGTVTATVSGLDTVGRSVTASSTATLRVPRPALGFAVTATPSPAVPGLPVTYSMAVTNSGDVALDGVAVHAAGTTACTRSLTGPLNPLASATQTCTLVVGDSTAATGFGVTARDAFGDDVSASASATVVVVRPVLTMALSGPLAPVRTGADTTVTVRLTNASPIPLTGLRVTGRPVACDHDLPSLAANATVTYTCVFALTAATTVTLSATGTPAIGGATVATGDTVTGSGDLLLVPQAPPPPTSPPSIPTTTQVPRPVTRAAPVLPPPVPPIPAAPTRPAPVPVHAPPVVAPPAPVADRPRPRVRNDRPAGPLTSPGRTAAIIAVLGVFVMTVSVGALSVATRPGK